MYQDIKTMLWRYGYDYKSNLSGTDLCREFRNAANDKPGVKPPVIAPAVKNEFTDSAFYKHVILKQDCQYKTLDEEVEGNFDILMSALTSTGLCSAAKCDTKKTQKH
jgi:hypothetical protein